MNFRSSLGFLTMAFVLPSLAGTTYYVRTDGSDSADGKSWATAWASAWKFTALKDGDELVISNGVYAVTEHTVPDYRVTIRGFSDNAADTVLDAGGSSRVFYTGSGSTPTIRNLTLRNGHPTNHPGGGLAIIGADEFLVSNVVFSSGIHPKTSGAARVIGSGIFVDCDFKNCEVSNGGGGAVCYSGNADDTVVFLRCRFEGNRALVDTKKGGGALYADTGNLVVSNCTFAGNCVPYTGGAILVSATAASATVFGSTFETNLVTSFSGTSKGGGAIADLNGNLTVDRCTFVTNDVIFGGGGAIYCGAASGVPVVRNSTFADNNKINRRNGGAILSAAGVDGDLYGPILTNCTFVNHSVDGNGGALYGKFKIVEDCELSGNAATGCGGAWYATMTGYAGTILPVSHFERCVFSGNSAGNRGGAFSTAYDQGVVVSTCTFAGNSAALYGSVYAADSYAPTSLTFLDCLLVTNFMSASSLAPVNGYAATVITALGETDVELGRCTFRGNRSLTYASAAYLPKNSYVHDCIFERNVLAANSLWTQSLFGGALHLWGTTNTVRNCLFRENVNRSGSGAAIYLGNPSSGTTDTANVIDNCDFIGNTSVTYGVGDAIGCTDVIHGTSPTARYANNLFLSNTNSASGLASTFSKEFHSHQPWKRCFSCCSDYDPATAGTGSEQWFSHNNMPSENACFQVADAAAAKLDANLVPIKGSPLVDVGTNLTWHAGASDLTGSTPRVCGKGPDIGYYEYLLLRRRRGIVVVLR